MLWTTKTADTHTHTLVHEQKRPWRSPPFRFLFTLHVPRHKVECPVPWISFGHTLDNTLHVYMFMCDVQNSRFFASIVAAACQGTFAQQTTMGTFAVEFPRKQPEPNHYNHEISTNQHHAHKRIISSGHFPLSLAASSPCLSSEFGSGTGFFSRTLWHVSVLLCGSRVDRVYGMTLEEVRERERHWGLLATTFSMSFFHWALWLVFETSAYITCEICGASG